MYINFSDSAVEVLKAQEQLCARVEGFYGKNSSEYLKMIESRLNCLNSIIRLGGEIYADGDLELVGQAEFLVYGMNFHYVKDNKMPINGTTIVPVIYGTWSINS